MIVSGWGTTSAGANGWGSGGALAAQLQYGTVKFVDTPTCSANYKAVSSYKISNSQFW